MSFFPGQGQQHGYPPPQQPYYGPPHQQNYGPPPTQNYGPPPPQGYPPQGGYPYAFFAAIKTELSLMIAKTARLSSVRATEWTTATARVRVWSTTNLAKTTEWLSTGMDGLAHRGLDEG